MMCKGVSSRIVVWLVRRRSDYVDPNESSEMKRITGVISGTEAPGSIEAWSGVHPISRWVTRSRVFDDEMIAEELQAIWLHFP
jgi:hypothetical protein